METMIGETEMSNRVCYYADEAMYDSQQQGYFIARVTENEAGYVQTFSLHSTVDEAKAVVSKLNAAMGLTSDDAMMIVASSMRQPGSVRR
jgi:hypothetical protein